MMSSGRTQAIVTNDDGFDAPGIRALIEALQGLVEIVVIAPASPKSGCGHAVSTHAPIAIDERSPGQFAIDGTPADCVRLGLAFLAPSARLVLSGINAGGNLGVDVHHSGTVAAAREGALRGLECLAVSQYIARGRPIDWPRAAALARSAIERWLGVPHDPGTYWNVNLPALDPEVSEPETVECPLDLSPIIAEYRREGAAATFISNYHARPRIPGGDIDVCFTGKVAVSKLALGT